MVSGDGVLTLSQIHLPLYSGPGFEHRGALDFVGISHFCMASSDGELPGPAILSQ